MNTQIFPVFNDNEVCLLRCDLYTGIVMDKYINFATNEDQEIWTVFNEIASAINEANKIVTEYDFIECQIFDKNKNLFKHIQPE